MSDTTSDRTGAAEPRLAWTRPVLEQLPMRETADGGLDPGELALPGSALNPS